MAGRRPQPRLDWGLDWQLTDKRPKPKLRRWAVKGFDNWLIFYQARHEGVEIVHVMHGARDIESLLGG